MSIRTLKFSLRRNSDNSRFIGCHASQQNLAYNHAVDVLNREPNPPKRSGRNHQDAMKQRTTTRRQADRQKANAPYHIHQGGAGQAWEANLTTRRLGPTAATLTSWTWSGCGNRSLTVQERQRNLPW